MDFGTLLKDPNVVEVAASRGLTPEQYLNSLISKRPIVETLESGVLTSPSVILGKQDNTDVGPLNIDGAMMNVGAGKPEVPEGFTVLKMPTGSDHSVLFNAETGETRPYTNASRQLFSNSVLERDIQELARDEYGRINVSEPILTAKRVAAEAEGDLQAAETGENLQASLDANAALNQAILTQDNYNPNVENATATSLQPFIDLPHGLDTFEEDYTSKPSQVTTGPVLNEPPEGFHRMHDGSMMADDEMSGSSNPYAPLGAGGMSEDILADRNAPPAVDSYAPLGAGGKSAGILADRNALPDGPSPILETDNLDTSSVPSPTRPTGNARGSNMPYAKIGMGESMMRMGLAGIGGSTKGFGASAAAIGNEMGNIEDANRATGIAEAQANEASRIANARQNAINAKSTDKAGGKNSEALDTINDSLWGMQNGLDAIAASRADGGNLTGVGGMFKGLIDSFTGDPDANRRLTLERLKVNDALLRTAETKGAISNSEMSLFLKPAPTTFKDEQVWVDWIKLRMEALRRVRTRLQGGVVLGPGERANNFGTYGSEGDFKFSPDVQSALDKYK